MFIELLARPKGDISRKPFDRRHTGLKHPPVPTGRVYNPNKQRLRGACPNATIRIAGQLSTKVASLCARAGWRSFSSAFASI
jgi:hypothetical protein